MISYRIYSAHGNDFALIDNRQGGSLPPPGEVQRLCSTRAPELDGLVVLERAEEGADAKMRIFNRDGCEAEMCGNGLRCLIRFLTELDSSPKIYRIETESGLHSGWRQGEEIAISFPYPGELLWDQTLRLSGREYRYHFINTGVPHALFFDTSLEEQVCSQIRSHPDFSPHGTNVTQIRILDSRSLAVKTYERGVEAFTGACGTGAVAAALAVVKLRRAASPVVVYPPSNRELRVEIPQEERSLTLFGQAVCVGEGRFELNP